MNFKSILAIGAHPDDIEISCFGFLLKQQKKGSKIHIFVTSPDSDEKGLLETRAEESKHAFFLIPESNFNIREKNKISMDDYIFLADYIREYVIQNNIDTVLVHDHDDTHQEHRLINEIVMTALRRMTTNIILYRSPSTENTFVSNYIVDIEKEYDTKVMAIKHHVTQSNKEYLFEDSLEVFNKGWNGKKMKINYYEEFKIFRLVEK